MSNFILLTKELERFNREYRTYYGHEDAVSELRERLVANGINIEDDQTMKKVINLSSEITENIEYQGKSKEDLARNFNKIIPNIEDILQQEEGDVQFCDLAFNIFINSFKPFFNSNELYILLSLTPHSSRKLENGFSRFLVLLKEILEKESVDLDAKINSIVNITPIRSKSNDSVDQLGEEELLANKENIVNVVDLIYKNNGIKQGIIVGFAKIWVENGNDFLSFVELCKGLDISQELIKQMSDCIKEETRLSIIKKLDSINDEYFDRVPYKSNFKNLGDHEKFEKKVNGIAALWLNAQNGSEDQDLYSVLFVLRSGLFQYNMPLDYENLFAEKAAYTESKDEFYFYFRTLDDCIYNTKLDQKEKRIEDFATIIVSKSDDLCKLNEFINYSVTKADYEEEEKKGLVSSIKEKIKEKALANEDFDLYAAIVQEEFDNDKTIKKFNEEFNEALKYANRVYEIVESELKNSRDVVTGVREILKKVVIFPYSDSLQMDKAFFRLREALKEKGVNCLENDTVAGRALCLFCEFPFNMISHTGVFGRNDNATRGEDEYYYRGTKKEVLVGEFYNLLGVLSNFIVDDRGVENEQLSELSSSLFVDALRSHGINDYEISFLLKLIPNDINSKLPKFLEFTNNILQDGRLSYDFNKSAEIEKLDIDSITPFHSRLQYTPNGCRKEDLVENASVINKVVYLINKNDNLSAGIIASFAKAWVGVGNNFLVFDELLKCNNSIKQDLADKIGECIKDETVHYVKGKLACIRNLKDNDKKMDEIKNLFQKFGSDKGIFLLLKHELVVLGEISRNFRKLLATGAGKATTKEEFKLYFQVLYSYITPSTKQSQIDEAAKIIVDSNSDRSLLCNFLQSSVTEASVGRRAVDNRERSLEYSIKKAAGIEIAKDELELNKNKAKVSERMNVLGSLNQQRKGPPVINQRNIPGRSSQPARKSPPGANPKNIPSLNQVQKGQPGINPKDVSNPNQVKNRNPL